MWFPNSIYKRDKDNIKSFQWEFKSYRQKKKKKTLPIVFEIRVNRSFTEVSTKDKKTATIE